MTTAYTNTDAYTESTAADTIQLLLAVTFYLYGFCEINKNWLLKKKYKNTKLALLVVFQKNIWSFLEFFQWHGVEATTTTTAAVNGVAAAATVRL